MWFNLKNVFELEKFREKVTELENKCAMVELKERRGRSLNQNAYLHLLLSAFALQYGYTLDEVKTCYFKRIVNRDLFVRQKHDDLLGTDREYVISTAKLTKEELSEAIERFRNWSSNIAGIYIPSSEEYIALLHIQHDVSNNKRYLGV